MDVNIDESWRNDETFRVENLGAFLLRSGVELARCLDGRDASILEQQIALGINARGWIDDAASARR